MAIDVKVVEITVDFGDYMDVSLTNEAALRAWLREVAAGDAARTFSLFQHPRCATVGLGEGYVVGLETDDSGEGAGPIHHFTGGAPSGEARTRRMYDFDDVVPADRVVPIDEALDVLVGYLISGRRAGSWDGEGAGPAAASEAVGFHARQLVAFIQRSPPREAPDEAVHALMAHSDDPDVLAYLHAYGAHRGHSAEIADYLCTTPTLLGERLCLGAVTDAAVLVEPDGSIALEPIEETFGSFEAFLAHQVARARERGAVNVLDD